jgi:hypothetical protein
MRLAFATILLIAGIELAIAQDGQTSTLVSMWLWSKDHWITSSYFSNLDVCDRVREDYKINAPSLAVSCSTNVPDWTPIKGPSDYPGIDVKVLDSDPSLISTCDQGWALVKARDDKLMCAPADMLKEPKATK